MFLSAPPNIPNASYIAFTARHRNSRVGPPWLRVQLRGLHTHFERSHQNRSRENSKEEEKEGRHYQR